MTVENCNNKPVTTKQRNHLIRLAQRKGQTFTPQDTCCSRHASKAISRLQRP